MHSMNSRRALLGACLLVQALTYNCALAADHVPTTAQPAAPAAELAATVPLTLQQAIAAALQGNPQLQAFTFQFRAGDVRTQQAGLRPAPEVSVDLENFAGSGETQGFDAAETTFALSQVIELGDKRDARIDAAQAGRSALDIERQAAQLDVRR